MIEGDDTDDGVISQASAQQGAWRLGRILLGLVLLLAVIVVVHTMYYRHMKKDPDGGGVVNFEGAPRPYLVLHGPKDSAPPSAKNMEEYMKARRARCKHARENMPSMGGKRPPKSEKDHLYTQCVEGGGVGANRNTMREVLAQHGWADVTGNLLRVVTSEQRPPRFDPKCVDAYGIYSRSKPGDTEAPGCPFDLIHGDDAKLVLYHELHGMIADDLPVSLDLQALREVMIEIKRNGELARVDRLVRKLRGEKVDEDPSSSVRDPDADAPDPDPDLPAS